MNSLIKGWRRKKEKESVNIAKSSTAKRKKEVTSRKADSVEKYFV
jgi:hypothetical protein